MFLLPIGRDNAVIRRHAYFTYCVMALYFSVFVFVAINNARHERGFVEDIRAIQVVVGQHPYLNLPKQLQVILGPERYRQLLDGQSSQGVYGHYAAAAEAQKRLDDLVVSAVDHYRNLGQIRYTYIPAESSLFKVLISMWVQFSFINVLIECLVLFSTAPYLEDVFGRPAFALLYVAGAFAAAVIYGSYTKDPTIGMYGAAGAVSAVFGAFLIRFFKSKLEFMFVPFFWRPTEGYRFFIPTWGVVGAWLVLQFLALRQNSGAAIANLGGFAFGAFFASGLRAAKYEDKHIAPAVAKQMTWTLNEHLSRAAEATDPETMQRELLAFLPVKPSNDEELQIALDLIRQALESASASFCAQAAAFADRNRAYDVATIAYDRVCQLDPGGANTIRHLLRLGTLKKQSGDVIGARTALMKAKTHSGCSAEIRANIEARLAQLQA